MARIKQVKSKPVTITLTDGKQRTVRFDLNALAALEDIYGSSAEAFRKLEEENSLKAFRSVLWAGLVHEDPELTEQQVGALVDTTWMASLTGSLKQALSNDMPEPEVPEVPEDSSDPNE